MASNVENSAPTKNKKAKVHAAASWEWFKSAAWLQVLLIVGVVVGIVISIPYIVTGIKNMSSDSSITFYNDHRITYEQFEKFINGEDDGCNGKFGAKNSTWSDTDVGFGVMFYKDNCDNCTSMQENLQNWFNRANDNAGGYLKFYTINVGWVPEDSSSSSTNESSDPNIYYKNDSITLKQQYELMQSIKSVYLSQDELHQNTSVDASTFEVDYSVTGASSKTLPTPMFLTFSKSKDAKTYSLNNPYKVMFTVLDNYETDSTGIAKSMYDLYNFTEGTVISSSSSSSSSS